MYREMDMPLWLPEVEAALRALACRHVSRSREVLRRLSREQAFDQRLSGQTEVLSYVAQDVGKGPNAEVSRRWLPV